VSGINTKDFRNILNNYNKAVKEAAKVTTTTDIKPLQGDARAVAKQ
jgi:hypothetical protein